MKTYVANLEQRIRRAFAGRLHGKVLLWKKSVRIFCDGGWPKFRWLPHFRSSYYDPYWGMKGFAVYLWGREINFTFGEDKNNLYHETNAEYFTSAR